MSIDVFNAKIIQFIIKQSWHNVFFILGGTRWIFGTNLRSNQIGETYIMINDAYFDASREINANICPVNDANILMGTFLHYSMSNVQINIQHQYNNQQNKWSHHKEQQQQPPLPLDADK